MMFKGQRLPPRLDSRRSLEEKIDMGHSLKQVPRLRLRSWAEAKVKEEAEIASLAYKAR